MLHGVGKILKQNEQKDSVFAELARAGHDIKWFVVEDGNERQYLFFIWNHRAAITYKTAKEEFGFQMPKNTETKVNTLKKPDNVQIQYVIANEKTIGFRLKKTSDKKWSQLFVFMNQIAEEPKANKKSK